MEVSVVTAVYNRADKVLKSVDSSLKMLGDAGIAGEVVVVDDASTDGTKQAIESQFARELREGRVKLLAFEENRGVTAAKQGGAAIARSKWVIFMDSDDYFLDGCGAQVAKVLEAQGEDTPLVFFRCLDQSTGHVIGPKLDEMLRLGIRDLLSRGTPGECMPAVRSNVIKAMPYSEDLRGFESLTHARIIRRFGHAVVSPVIARAYCTDSQDRLSTRAGLRKRSCHLSRGYLRLLHEFYPYMIPRIPVALIKLSYHTLHCILFTLQSRKF